MKFDSDTKQCLTNFIIIVLTLSIAGVVLISVYGSFIPSQSLVSNSLDTHVQDAPSTSESEQTDTQNESSGTDSSNSARIDNAYTQQISNDLGDYKAPTIAYNQADEDAITQIITQMSDREKINQLFLVSHAKLLGTNTYALIAREQMLAALQEHPVGGVELLEANVSFPGQLEEYTRDLTKNYASLAAKTPFIAITETPASPTVASLHDFALEIPSAKDSKRISAYLSQYGITMNFGLPLSSADFTQLSEQEITDAVQVYRAHNMLVVATDFLGTGDLHLYEVAIDAGLSAVQLSAEATFNSTLLTDLLRQQVGYEGLIISAPLNDKRLLDEKSSTSASDVNDLALEALLAGCDVLYEPEDLAASVERIYTALQDGKLSTDKLDRALRCILRAKQIRSAA